MYFSKKNHTVQLIIEQTYVQVLNMLACWIEDPNSEAFKLHIPRIYDYLWVAEDGMKMQVMSFYLLHSFTFH